MLGLDATTTKALKKCMAFGRDGSRIAGWIGGVVSVSWVGVLLVLAAFCPCL